MVPIVGLCFLLAAGAGLGRFYETLQASRGALSSAVLQRLSAAEAGAILQAVLILLLWVVLQIIRKTALFAAFLFVEAYLPGRRLNSETFRFALAVQFSIALIYTFGATALAIFPALRATPAPLITIGQAQLEALLGPLAPLAVALAALLVYDFVGYWVHRAQHHFSFLWRFHAVHHSVEDMDSLNSYQHPADAFVVLMGIAAVAMSIGFTFATLVWFLAFQTIHDRLLHTRAPVNFGILGKLLVDNRTHFLHHTRIESRSGRNFAAMFTLFDRIFGTYDRPEPGCLSATGLEGLGPPATLADFFLARLDGRAVRIMTKEESTIGSALGDRLPVIGLMPGPGAPA